MVRRLRTYRTVVVTAMTRAVVATVAVAAVSSGCGSEVTGTATPARDAPVRHVARALSTMLPATSAFPQPYQAVVLPPQAVADAASDLSGVPSGAKVQPGGCKPPEAKPGPDDTVIAVGTDDATRATITVELTRTSRPLSERRAQLRQCPTVRATKNGASSTVRSQLATAPRVDADDALALRQTVESKGAGTTVRQSMTSRVAQVGDVRASVTFMSFRDAAPDTAVLERLFTQTVATVRSA